MKDLTKISTPEITLDVNRTQQVLANDPDGEWGYPEFLSVFVANIEEESLEITACIPMDYNLLLRKSWAHLLVRPSTDATPTYTAMSKIAQAFFKTGHHAMQIIPRCSDYISREKHTLHLWNVTSDCSFQFDEVHQLLSQNLSDIDTDIYLQVSEDSNSNQYLAIAAKDRWLCWEDIVSYKEKYLGADIDAVIVNRSFKEDIQNFSSSKYKVIIIWEASSIELPDKILV